MNLGISTLTQISWGAAALLQAGLLITIVVRKLQRSFPALTAYLSLNLIQDVLLVFVYSHAGFNSVIAWRLGWVSEGVVVAARAVAASELCHHAVARFRGVWALGSRVLALAAGVVLISAITLGQHSFRVVMLTLDLGLELAIAMTVIGLFVFAKHYGLEIHEPLRSLGLGFCLYSLVRVVNNIFGQRIVHGDAEIWNLVGMIALVASVAIWLRAFLKAVPVPAPQPVMLDAKVYPTLMPEVNRRLALLNEQLSRIWKAETRHT